MAGGDSKALDDEMLEKRKALLAEKKRKKVLRHAEGQKGASRIR